MILLGLPALLDAGNALAIVVVVVCCMPALVVVRNRVRVLEAVELSGLLASAPFLRPFALIDLLTRNRVIMILKIYIGIYGSK